MQPGGGEAEEWATPTVLKEGQCLHSCQAVGTTGPSLRASSRSLASPQSLVDSMPSFRTDLVRQQLRTARLVRCPCLAAFGTAIHVHVPASVGYGDLLLFSSEAEAAGVSHAYICRAGADDGGGP